MAEYIQKWLKDRQRKKNSTKPRNLSKGVTFLTQFECTSIVIFYRTYVSELYNITEIYVGDYRQVSAKRTQPNVKYIYVHLGLSE